MIKLGAAIAVTTTMFVHLTGASASERTADNLDHLSDEALNLDHLSDEAWLFYGHREVFQAPAEVSKKAPKAPKA